MRVLDKLGLDKVQLYKWTFLQGMRLDGAAYAVTVCTTMEPPDVTLIIMIGLIFVVTTRPLIVGANPESWLGKLFDVEELRFLRKIADQLCCMCLPVPIRVNVHLENWQDLSKGRHG